MLWMFYKGTFLIHPLFIGWSYTLLEVCVPVLDCFIVVGDDKTTREKMITMAMVTMTTKIRDDNHKRF